MSHDLHSRAIVPDSMMACRMTPKQEAAVRKWIKVYVVSGKISEADGRYLLAVWLGDPLD